jgi:hypothetical protein
MGLSGVRICVRKTFQNLLKPDPIFFHVTAAR